MEECVGGRENNRWKKDSLKYIDVCVNVCVCMRKREKDGGGGR